MCSCLLCCTCYEKRPCQLRRRERCELNEEAVSEWTNVFMPVLPIKRAATTTANITAHIHDLTSEVGIHWTVLEISNSCSMNELITIESQSSWLCAHTVRYDRQAMMWVHTRKCFPVCGTTIGNCQNSKAGWFAGNNFKKTYVCPSLCVKTS